MNPIRWLIDFLLGSDDVAPPDPDEPALVALPSGRALAEALQAKLESFGIVVLLRNTSPLAHTQWEHAATWELYVANRDLDRAREILGIEDPEAGEEDGATDEGF